MDKSQRSVPVRVLHLAMPRTGSLSMMKAYNLLGLSTYHGFDFLVRHSDQVQWEKAIDAKYCGKGKPFEKEDFDAFLGDFEVLSDFPVLGFTEEFLKWYPEAKVVLVERDIEKWYHSFDTNIIQAMYTWMILALRYIIDPYIATTRSVSFMRLMYAFFNAHDRESFQANARDTYRKHYEIVRELVPKERILEYQLGSGWRPLCEFLGEEVPDVEFPFMNESNEMAKYMHDTQMRVLKEGLWTAWKLSMVPGAVAIIAIVAYAVLKLGSFD